jgi:hypothetical protein
MTTVKESALSKDVIFRISSLNNRPCINSHWYSKDPSMSRWPEKLYAVFISLAFGLSSHGQPQTQSKPVLTLERVAYAANKHSRDSVIIDGQEGPPETEVYLVFFSPDGKELIMNDLNLHRTGAFDPRGRSENSIWLRTALFPSDCIRLYRR